MKSGTAQFDMRENAASERRHASRRNAGPTATIVSNSSTRPGADFPSPNSVESAAVGAGNRATGKQSASMTVQEVAQLLQVPLSWVYGRMRQRSLDRLPAYKLGKYWRFRESEVVAWIKHHQRGSDAS